MSSIGGLACWVADRYSWPVITAGSVVVLYVVFRKGYTGSLESFILLFTNWMLIKLCYAEESLLVIRGMGIQTSTSSAMYWSSASTRFIPTTQIQDIVIHEAFKAFEVRFYLAIIVEGESDVVVVFPVCIQCPNAFIYAVLMLSVVESITQTFDTRRSLERCPTLSL